MNFVFTALKNTEELAEIPTKRQTFPAALLSPKSINVPLCPCVILAQPAAWRDFQNLRKGIMHAQTK